MKNIKTGADKLVEFISQKKRIDLDSAAKELGVGSNVVQEWAEFLEQEGLISIEYTLSKTWFTEKQISRDDVLMTAKEASSEKDAFVRKIDVALKSLDNETLGFEDIKKHFVEIQSHIKKEIDVVKSDLDELERYDALKKNLDKDIAAQRQSFQELVRKYTLDVNTQEVKFSESTKAIERERNNIEQISLKIQQLKQERAELEKVLSNTRDTIRLIDTGIETQKSNLSVSEKKITELKNNVDKLITEIEKSKDRAVGDLTRATQSETARILNAEDELLKKAIEKTNQMSTYLDTGKKVYEGFKGFFIKNIETEKLIYQIGNDKQDMHKDLEELRKKAQALSIMSKTTNIAEQFKDIEESLKNFEKRKGSLAGKVEKLIDMIKGNTM